MITRTFTVPPDFLTRGGPAGPGPAAARQVLESLGVTFRLEGSSAVFDKSSSRLIVRNTVKQLDLVETLVGALLDDSGNVVEGLLQFEIISLPLLATRKALIAHPVEAELYQWLDTALEKKDSGVVLEHTQTLRVRGGQRSKVEGINEFAYATKWDPAQIPQNISLAASTDAPAKEAGNGRIFPPWPYTAITPNSFTIRNLGWTVEAELIFGEDKSADLNLAPELMRVVAQIPQGLAGEISQPVFETQKSTTQVHTWVGQPALVSTLSPPTDTGAPGGNKDDRVWLLFVTVTRPQ